MNVFKYQDYKQFLREGLHEKKTQVSSRFTYERMAKACGIQKTYLSRVLNSDDTHLSEEQLFLCATFLGLAKEERQYLQLLRSHQRANVASFKEELRAEIERERALRERSEPYLKAETFAPAQDISPFYLDPHVMLVHIFLSVERFRKDVKTIGLQLHLTENYLAEILTKLEQMKLIELTGDGYVLLKSNTHLPVDSPLYYPYRFMQRIKSLERIQKLPKEQTYNYSVVFSADEAARQEIKRKFLEFLSAVETIAKGAKEAEVYQMNFDLFDWSVC